MKLTFDASGELVTVAAPRNVRTSTKKPEFEAGPFAFFTCDECGGKIKESDLSLCRKRGDLGFHSFAKYLVCTKCYVRHQDKYISDSPAPGVYFVARHLKIELKEL